MEQFRPLWGLVLLQLLHSLHEVLHSPVHVCPCGATPHAQPQRVLRHLWGNPTAQQHWGGPGTQPRGGGWTGRPRKPHTSAGSFAEPHKESHLQIHSRAPVPCTALFAFQGHPIPLGSSKKNLLHVSVGWQLLVSRPGQKHPQPHIPQRSHLEIQAELEQVSQEHTDTRQALFW